MQKQLRNIIFGAVGFVVFLFLAQYVVLSARDSIRFDYTVYQEYQTKYEQQDVYFEDNQQKITDYVRMLYSHTAPETINESIHNILPEPVIDTGFVSSNDDQVREMASLVLAEAQEIFGTENAKMVNAVYAIDEVVAVYLQQPQSYLFYALTSDQSQIIGFVVTPSEDGYNIEELWSLDQAADVDFTTREANRALFIFTNKIF